MLQDFISPVTDNLNVILYLSTCHTVYIPYTLYDYAIINY